MADERIVPEGITTRIRVGAGGWRASFERKEGEGAETERRPHTKCRNFYFNVILFKEISVRCKHETRLRSTPCRSAYFLSFSNFPPIPNYFLFLSDSFLVSFVSHPL